MDNISYILNLFGLKNNYKKIEKINSGHINSTYKIIYSSDESYILQKINGNIFNEPEKIMSNIEGICNCLKGKVNCPEFKKYKNKNYIIIENTMWRIYRYIENSVCRNSLESLNEIYEFGKVAGNFHRLTQKLDTENFFKTIENFHNTNLIIQNLLNHKNSEYEYEFNFFEKTLEYSEILSSKKLPQNITHNDVKCSNVLFDKKSGKGITLIDFDTVMPGLWVYDFGDGARSACVTENKLDTEKFRAYCKGYFSCIKPQNAENYFLGTYCITAELSARYFKDFLLKENYFADKTEIQKLSRSRELTDLAESIIENKDKILKIIKDFE